MCSVGGGSGMKLRKNKRLRANIRLKAGSRRNSPSKLTENTSWLCMADFIPRESIVSMNADISSGSAGDYCRMWGKRYLWVCELFELAIWRTSTHYSLTLSTTYVITQHGLVGLTLWYGMTSGSFHSKTSVHIFLLLSQAALIFFSWLLPICVKNETNVSIQFALHL